MKKLTSNDYFYFREGMELRKKHLMEIFGTHIYDVAYPDLVEKTKGYLYRGTNKLKREVPRPIDYKFFWFENISPDVCKLLLDGEEPKASILNNLPPAPQFPEISQAVHAMRSGILKHGSQGYYFDKEGAEKFLAYKLTGGNENENGI